jgi:transcriptional antiterminator RfaH
MGYDVLVPFEKRIQRKPGCKARAYESALFPRYGFVRFGIENDHWGEIKAAAGVLDLVRTNSVPRTVPDQAIEALKLAEAVGTFDRTVPPKVGVKVEATDGPFSGFIGTIIRARTGDRVDLLAKILGAERIVTMPLSTLREA